MFLGNVADRADRLDRLAAMDAQRAGDQRRDCVAGIVDRTERRHPKRPVPSISSRMVSSVRNTPGTGKEGRNDNDGIEMTKGMTNDKVQMTKKSQPQALRHSSPFPFPFPLYDATMQ